MNFFHIIFSFCRRGMQSLNILHTKLFDKQILIIGIFIFIVSSVFLHSCVYYRTSLEEKYTTQAEQLYTNKQYAESLEYYKKIKSISSSNNAAYRIAEISIRLKKYDEARKEITRLLRRDKENILVQELDAHWYYINGDIQIALEKYLALEERTPYNTRILSNIGIIYQQKSMVQFAVKYFNKVLQIDILEPTALESYIKAIISLPMMGKSTNGIDSVSVVQVYLSTIVKRYIESFKSNDFSTEKLYQIAELLKKTYVDYAYPVFTTIADVTINNVDDVQTNNYIAQSNYIIVEMILNKEYVPLDVDSLQLLLKRLSRAINSGYGDTQSEIDSLLTLTDKVETEVLKRRIFQLYVEEKIISSENYDALLEQLVMEQNESTETLNNGKNNIGNLSSPIE